MSVKKIAKWTLQNAQFLRFLQKSGKSNPPDLSDSIGRKKKQKPDNIRRNKQNKSGSSNPPNLADHIGKKRQKKSGILAH